MFFSGLPTSPTNKGTVVSVFALDRIIENGWLRKSHIGGCLFSYIAIKTSAMIVPTMAFNFSPYQSSTLVGLILKMENGLESSHWQKLTILHTITNLTCTASSPSPQPQVSTQAPMNPFPRQPPLPAPPPVSSTTSPAPTTLFPSSTATLLSVSSTAVLASSPSTLTPTPWCTSPLPPLPASSRSTRTSPWGSTLRRHSPTGTSQTTVTGAETCWRGWLSCGAWVGMQGQALLFILSSQPPTIPIPPSPPALSTTEPPDLPTFLITHLSAVAQGLGPTLRPLRTEIEYWLTRFTKYLDEGVPAEFGNDWKRMCRIWDVEIVRKAEVEVVEKNAVIMSG
ncbi:hypothetical protein BC938DRAFT_482638 [Jimgerdemannia flammicorona]|uniref:Uncharacterized protein n=1 Tax=Jimgerdemannia flammicorona TaxID=994334 RepID=A0A433QDM4_9FUNG|nr:hypothetical protein BC938DRAFT_482638 [Jimgerdemannia flammicorona]